MLTAGHPSVARHRMIYANVLLTAKDEKDIPALTEWLREQGRLSRKEPGCLRFEVYHSKSDPKVFLLVERWESAGALDVHRTAKAYTEIYQPNVLPRTTRSPHPSDLIE
jgi:quinol monooxygenase YgiN